MSFEKNQTQMFGFTTRLASDHVTPTVPTNPVATLSKDGAGFNGCSNAVSSVANGHCVLTLTADEMDCNVGCIRITSDNCDPAHVEFFTEADWTATRAALVDNADAAISGLNDLSTADVNAEVDTALADYAPPTKAEMDAGHTLLAPASTALTNLTWTDTRAGYLDRLDQTLTALGAAIRGADSDTLKTLSDALDVLANRLGAFTGSGVNTVLGLLKAIAQKAATLPTDIGGTYDVTTDSLEALRDHINDQSFLNFVSGTITASSVTNSGVVQTYTSNDEIVIGSQWPPADETVAVRIDKTAGWPAGAATWTWKMHISRELDGSTPDLTLTASSVTVTDTLLVALFQATPAQTATLPAAGWYHVDVESEDGSGVSSYWDAMQGRARVRNPVGQG